MHDHNLLMTEQEALQLAAEHLRSHRCDQCGKQWITGRTVGVLMHRCTPSRSSRWDFRSREERIAEDNRRWALTVFGEAVEEAVGPDTWYEEEE